MPLIVSAIDLAQPMTQQAFADLVGVSQPAVSVLASAGVLAPGVAGLDWLRAYVAHLTDVAARRAATISPELVGARARLARVQAELREHDLADGRSGLLPAGVAQGQFEFLADAIGNVLAALPAALALALPELAGPALALIEREILRAQAELDALRSAESLTEGAADATE